MDHSKRRGGRRGRGEGESAISSISASLEDVPLSNKTKKKVIAAVEYCDPRSLKDVFVSHISLYHSYIIR